MRCDIYIDESSQTNHRFLLLGGLILPAAEAASFETEAIRVRGADLPARELPSDTRSLLASNLLDQVWANSNFACGAFRVRPIERHCHHGNGPLWDGKVYKRAKFGDPFDPGTVKGAQRRQQIARQRRKWAAQDRRWCEQQEAEQPSQLRWPFRVLRALAEVVFKH